MTKISIIYFLNIYLIWGRKWAQAGVGQTERERENLKQTLYCQHRAWCRTQTYKTWDHDMTWNQESVAQPTEPPRCSTKMIKIFKRKILAIKKKKDNQNDHLGLNSSIITNCVILIKLFHLSGSLSLQFLICKIGIRTFIYLI